VSAPAPLLAVDDTLREMTSLFTATWLSDVLPKALGLSRPTLHNSDMATYDFAWLWRELKVEDLRR
jgi:hypothetical protein